MQRTRTRLKIFVLFFSSLFIHAVNAQPMYAFLSAADTNRFNMLTKEIRCVVCQNQNLAESSAPLAYDMREKIYELIKINKTNEEIKSYLVTRYGEFILLRPPFSKATVVLWGFPFMGLLVVFMFLYRLLRTSPHRGRMI